MVEFFGECIEFAHISDRAFAAHFEFRKEIPNHNRGVVVELQNHLAEWSLPLLRKPFGIEKILCVGLWSSPHNGRSLIYDYSVAVAQVVEPWQM